MSLSGILWVNQFPTSTSVDDLSTGFRPQVVKFLDALAEAKVNITITATRRPAQRAYLMHYAWCISRAESDRNWVDPAKVPAYTPQPGALLPVDIDWLHVKRDGTPDPVASKQAALVMVSGFGIAATLLVPPALTSLHITGDAIDMQLSWAGSLVIADATGTKVTIASTPRDGTNAELIKVGATYKVIHLIDVQKDPPHWSTTGH